MKKIKLLSIIFISFFCIGCSNDKQDLDTIYYNLNINTVFEEKITVYLDKDAEKKAKENQEEEENVVNLEFKLLREDINPIFSNTNIFYNKNISKNSDGFKVDLEYNYIEEDFISSNYIMNCFENYDIKSNKGSLEIYLSGKFYCLNDKKNVNIRVSSIFDAENSNGVIDGNVYSWNINEENVNNVDIRHTIIRNYEGMETDRENINTNSNTSISGGNLIRIIISGVVIIGLIILKKYNKNNNY